MALGLVCSEVAVLPFIICISWIHDKSFIIPLCVEMFALPLSHKNSIRDACTPQPGEIIFHTMRIRRSETEADQETFIANSVSYIKIQIMLSTENNITEKMYVKIKYYNKTILQQDDGINQ